MCFSGTATVLGATVGEVMDEPHAWSVASSCAVEAHAVAVASGVALGFDAGYARALGLRSPLPDAVLLVLIALCATVSVSAVGSLLVTALFVVPAATVRLLTRRVTALQIGSVALVAAEMLAARDAAHIAHLGV